MGIRQFKPVTKGTRFRSVSDFAEITRTTPEKSLLEPLKKSGGRDNHGHISMRRRRRWPQAQVPHHRLQARTSFGIVGDGEARSSTIRTARRASRWSSTRTARSATSCTRRGSTVGDTIVSGPGSDVRTGNALPLERDAARHRRAQRRAEDRQGRPDGALGRACRRRWWRRKASTSRCAWPSTEMRLRARPLPGDDRRGRQRRARADVVGQGGQEPLAGQAPEGAR